VPILVALYRQHANTQGGKKNWTRPRSFCSGGAQDLNHFIHILYFTKTDSKIKVYPDLSTTFKSYSAD